MYKDLLQVYASKSSNSEIASKWHEKEEEFLEKVHEKCPELYHDYVQSLYVVLYGYHFNEDMARKAVEHMVNNDGTTGAHWSYEQSLQLAQRAGINFNTVHFNEWDWYYVINMIYSDYYGVLTDDTTSYIRVAQAFLDDKDAPDGKAYRYYKAMATSTEA